MLVDIIYKRPEDVKAGFLAALKKLKAGDRFFRTADFEDMFENYNFFQDKNQNLVHVNNLVQSLNNVSIEINEEQLKEKHPELLRKGYLKKDEFV